MDEHRVRNQSWKVTTTSAEEAFVWRTFLHREGEGLLSPLLEEVFKECGVGDRELRLGSLHVQVTVASPGQLAEALPTALRREILQKLHMTDQVEEGEQHLDADGARENVKGVFDRLLGYLERGFLPWEWQHLPVQEAAGLLTETAILHFERLVAHLQQVPENGVFWSRLLQILPMPLRQGLFDQISAPPPEVQQLQPGGEAFTAGRGEEVQGVHGLPAGNDPTRRRRREDSFPESLSRAAGSAMPKTAHRRESSAASPLPGRGAAEKQRPMHGGEGAMAAFGTEPGKDFCSISPPLHSGQGENLSPGQQEEPLTRGDSAAIFTEEAPARAKGRETAEGSMPQRQRRGRISASADGYPKEGGTRTGKSPYCEMANGEAPSGHGAADSPREREAGPADQRVAANWPQVPVGKKGQASGDVALHKTKATPGKGGKEAVGPGGMAVAAGLSETGESQSPFDGIPQLERTTPKGSRPPAAGWTEGVDATVGKHRDDGQAELRPVPGDRFAAQQGETEGNEQAHVPPAAMAPGLPAAERSRQNRPQTYPILVHQGGLILLHPFMARFLGHCGVLDAEEKRIADGCAERAAALLHHLATGREEIFEFELGLEKVLLGLSPHMPLPRCQGLVAEEDRREAENLLQSAIGHWAALKNTSVDGFRGSFLQRPALLREEGECWKLQVERKAFDLLLDHLPWSIGIMRLPWMTKPLHTEW